MNTILRDSEPHPAEVINAAGQSPFVLVCEHASNRMPQNLGTLGLPEADLQRHIAWDIGAEATARILSKILDAPLILQRYSRLVYDCNRPPEAEGAMPVLSEIYEIPGNRNLTPAAKLARTREIARPFHQAIEDVLDDRATHGRQTLVASIHSFTGTYKGKKRDLDVGFLFDRDPALANHLIKVFPQDKARLNEPYGPKDGVMYLLNRHAAPRGLHHVMIEIRNDLIADHAGQNSWANYLVVPLAQAAIKLTKQNARP
ncbi:MAG: N-formylglutamate amidohydrolase [Hyphomicrobiales bacterium]